MDAPAPHPLTSDDPALSRALDALVADGVLTTQQAQSVTAAHNEEIARTVPTGGTAPVDVVSGGPASLTSTSAGNRLPEVLGYLGGTFVVAAAVLVVGWSWESFDKATKLLITVLSAVIVYGAGLAIGLGAAGGRATLRRPDQDIRRRLVGVLLVVGAFVAAGAVALLMDDSVEILLLPIGAAALVLSAVAVRLAPGVAPTLGLFAATVLLAFTPSNFSGEVPVLTWVLIFMSLGVVWVALGPWVTRTLSAALFVGLGDLVIIAWIASAHEVPVSELASGRGPGSGAEALRRCSGSCEWGEQYVQPLGYAVLAILTILGVALYLRGQPWPWLVAATVSAAVLVFQLAGDAFGPAVAALVLGALLLAASGLLILRRGRAEARAGPDADVGAVQESTPG